MENENESPGSSLNGTGTENSSPLLSTDSDQTPAISPAGESEPQKRSHHKKKTATGPKFKASKKRPAAHPSSNASSPGSEESPSSAKSSSPGSTKFLGKGKGSLDSKDKKALVASIAKGVRVGTAMGSSVIVKDPVEKANGLFIATEAEAEGIARPLVSILDRRGIGAGAGDSDTADLIALVMEFVNYLRGNFALRAAIKQEKRAQAGANQGVDTGSEETIVRQTSASAPAAETVNTPAAETVNEPSVGAQVLEGLLPLGML